MHEVSTRALLQLLDCAKGHGVDTTVLIREQPHPPHYIKDTRNRLDWADFARVVRKCGENVGGRDGLYKLGLEFASLPVGGFARVMAGYFTDCRQLYHYLSRWIGPLFFSHLDFRVNDLPDGSLGIEVCIPDTYEDPPEFHAITHGALTGIPRLLGLENASVAFELKDRRARYVVSLPPSMSFGARLRRTVKMSLGAGNHTERLSPQEAQLAREFTDLFSLHHDLVEILEKVPVGVLIMNEGHAVYTNESLMKSLGLKSGDSQGGVRLEDMIDLSDRPAWNDFLKQREKTAAPVEVRFNVSPGEIVTMELTAVEGVRLGHDKAMVIMARDVTESRKLEQEVIHAVTMEQGRIGRYLHDGLGQHLTGIAFKSRNLEQSLQDACPSLAPEAGKVCELANLAAAQATYLARGLNPVPMDREGLRSALENMAHNTEDAFNVHCSVDAGAASVSDPFAAAQLFRIAQEAVTNAIQHGHAKDVAISVSRNEGRLKLAVIDNGEGFNPASPLVRGMGLRNMQYRAKMIGGSLRIARREGGGIVLTCETPGRDL